MSALPVQSAAAAAVAAVAPLSPASASKAAASGFGDVLVQAVRQVNDRQQEANRAVERFLNGESGELHSTILQVQRAELSLELFLQFRNKAVQAYQEIMRTQL